jgi:hypothetical protein
MPPRQIAQFLILAGHGLLPARHFETRAANRLLKDKKVRVFSDALDRNWSSEMSKAKVAGDPNSAIDREFFIGNHCTHISAPFVSSVRNTGFLTPLGSSSREFEPSVATGGGALGRVHAGAWCGNVHRYKMHPSAYGGRSAQHRTRRTGIELAVVFLRSEVAMAAVDKRDLSGERGCAGPVHAFTANRRECRPEGRMRGLKVCR